MFSHNRPGARILRLKPSIEVRDGVMIVGRKYRGHFEKRSNPMSSIVFRIPPSWIPAVCLSLRPAAIPML